jgi:capsular polysaccharide biosynthesis protein
MEKLKSAQAVSDAMMDEFQLTELESRLEMAVTVSPEQDVQLVGYCCECVGNPYCGME